MMKKPMFLKKIFKKKEEKKNKHRGSNFDDFLKEEGIYEEVSETAKKRVGDLEKLGETVERLHIDDDERDGKTDDNIPINDNIFFNPLTNCYVIFLKSFGKNVVIPEQQVKSIFLTYSDMFGKPSTVEQVARMLKWTRPCAAELLKLFNANHNMLPVTPYELLNKSDEEIVEDIDAHRNFVLQQKIEHKTWNSVKEESLKWREFQHNVVFPLELFLQTWCPPKFQPVKPAEYRADEKIVLASFNDLHIGAYAKANKTFSGKEFNTELAVAALLNSYIGQLKTKLSNFVVKPKKVVVLFNGDIAHSFADNFTRRGTELNSEYTNEDLFKIVLNLIIDLVRQIAMMFKEVEVIVGKGNHDSHVALYLGMAAEKYFKDQKNVKFDIESKWIFSRWINNVFMISTHGVHDTMKNIGVPKTAAKLKEFVNNHLVEKAAEIGRAGQRILVMGHLHSLYCEDMGSFRVYRFGSGVRSDEHSQSLGHFTPPYQNCLLIGKDKVEDVWDIYL